MVRMQVRLSQEQAEAVGRVAAREGRSMAAVIRSCVDAGIRRSTTAERRRRALDAVGRFRCGASNLAENHDAALDEAFMGQLS